MTGRSERALACAIAQVPGDMSPRPGAGVLVWAALVVLATGCCATQPIGGKPSIIGAPPIPNRPEPRPTLPADPPEFAVIDTDEVRRRLWPEPGPPAYVAPDERQTTALATLVRGMLAEPMAPRAELALAASAAGFALEGWSVAGRHYLAALEQPNRRGGGGAYIVRVPEAPATPSTTTLTVPLTAPPTAPPLAPPGTVATTATTTTVPAPAQALEPPTILQAPHGFFDLGTETIALEILLSEPDWPRALFVNTVHRYLGHDGVRRKQQDSPADPCHSNGHLLAVATGAALDAQPHAEIIQLHGFGDHDDNFTGPQPAAIVSAGLPDAPTPRSRLLAARLRDALGVEVALFPVDTDRLGATTNVQGRVIHARGGAEFLHIEMSASLRQWLRNDAAARARLVTALRRDPRGSP